jgi:uncharacterized protein DUF1353
MRTLARNGKRPARTGAGRSAGYLLPIALLAPLFAGGCGGLFYSETPTGVFAGKLTVEWIEPNLFIYRPDSANPLVYTTADGHKIQPRLMLTDGGSIPRLFWASPGLGPWDFAPGYIIHDWLFEQHHCKEGDWQATNFKRSASILAEAMKTQMVNSGKPDPTIVWAVHAAVSSEIAQTLWDTGACKPLPAAPLAPGAAKAVPIKIIEFR